MALAFLVFGVLLLNTVLAAHYDCDLASLLSKIEIYCRISNLSIETESEFNSLTVPVHQYPTWLDNPKIDFLSSEILTKINLGKEADLLVEGGSVRKIYVPPTLLVLAASRNGLEKLVIPTSEKVYLSFLDISQNSLTEIPKDIKYCKQLQTLKLTYNQIETVNLDVLKGLNKLQSLDLGFNRIHSVAASAALKFPTLTEMVLKNNNLSNFTLKGLQFPRLAKFLVEHNTLIEIDDFVEQFPSLQMFQIRNNTWNCTALRKIFATIELKQAQVSYDNDVSCCKGSAVGGICCVEESAPVDVDQQWQHKILEMMNKLNENLNAVLANQQKLLQHLVEQNSRCNIREAVPYDAAFNLGSYGPFGNSLYDGPFGPAWYLPVGSGLNENSYK